MSSWWERHVVPKLINCACRGPSIMKQREKVVPGAAGRVLELGMGTGINLPLYDAAKVTAVEAVEPSDEMRAMAEAAAAQQAIPTHIAAGRGEELPYEDRAFDCVLCTFTLCSVQDPGAVLAEARRVLKPGGRFLFCEHGLAPDPDVVKWQRRIEPIWRPIAGGCHLTRPVTRAIEAAGFKVERQDSMYLPGAPRWAGWNEWGEATPA